MNKDKKDWLEGVAFIVSLVIIVAIVFLSLFAGIN